MINELTLKFNMADNNQNRDPRLLGTLQYLRNILGGRLLMDPSLYQVVLSKLRERQAQNRLPRNEEERDQLLREVLREHLRRPRGVAVVGAQEPGAGGGRVAGAGVGPLGGEGHVAELMDIDNAILDDNNHVVGGPFEVMQIECEISEDLSDKVFENDMLREMILDYVIYPNGKVSRPDVKNLRLVRKSWLRATADSMRKCRVTMFTLTLDNSTSLSLMSCDQMENNAPTKHLYQFVRAMASQTRLPDFIPPFSLKLTPEFFRRENYTDLSDCLICCGEALIDFDLSFPINSSMTFVFPSFYLPQLQRLAVQFSNQRLNDLSVVIQNSGHTIYPLQTILNGTDELKELIFKYANSESLIPFGFEFLVLPETITRLYLDCPVKDSDLHLLIKNDLPNLTSLRLFTGSTPYSDGTIFQVLRKYQTTLRTISLRGHHYHGRVANATFFRFPVMEKLEALTVTSQCWEFADGLNHLETQLPKMNELRILHTRESMYTKWTQNSQFEAVQRLFVSLIDVNAPAPAYLPNQAEVPMTLTLEKMQSLHLAFPNVVNLEMTLWGPLTCGLKYLFIEMRSLEKLAITVKGTNYNQFHPGHWDSALIGVPMDMVMSFRNNPEYLGIVDLRNDNNFPSILNLNALSSLALVDSIPTSGDPAGNNASLISDLSFQFAFLRMPNLRNLLLHGRFSASPLMTERWKQEKGSEIRGIVAS